MSSDKTFSTLQEVFTPNLVGSWFRHNKTGLEVVFLKNDDPHRTFAISFYTPPSDSKGTPHILEHSVLCGSKKYPLKDPFAALLKSSLHTYLNAYTAHSYTVYPASSQNLKDFENLFSVYWDSVFHPLLTEETFARQAWHYRMNGKLTRSGVVYNEMKGRYADVDSLLYRTTLRALFPNSQYEFDSGGDPAQIPHLTYEQLLEFHREFYHPSNSRVLFYGDLDLNKILDNLNDLLSGFESKPKRKEPDVEFGRGMNLTVPYQGDGKYIVSKAWPIKLSGDLKDELCWSLFEEVLYGTQGSPLYLALIESGLGERTAGFGLVDTNRDAFFSCGLRGVSKIKEVITLIDRTLESLPAFSVETVRSALAAYEFRLREEVFNSSNKGIQILSYIIPPWIFRDAPFRNVNLLEAVRALSVDELINAFENRLKPQEGYEIVLEPDPQLFQAAEIKEAEELSKTTIEDEEKVRQLQRAVDDVSPDSDELLNLVPTLTLSDLSREIVKFPLEISKLDNGSEVLLSQQKTNGITYVQYGFDGFRIPKHLLPWVTLLSRVLTGVGTKSRNLVNLTEAIQQYTGGIGLSRLTGTCRATKAPVFKLFLESSCLDHNLGAMLDLLREVSVEGVLDNKERILQIIGELRDSYEQALSTRPYGFAHRRALSSLTTPGLIEELLGGFEQLRFLRSLSSESFETISNNLKQLRDILFTGIGVTVCVTKSDTNVSSEVSLLDSWQKNQMPSCAISPEKTKDQLLVAPLRVAYTCQVNMVEDMPSGSVDVVLSQVSDTYLWNEIRVGGGAYGASCGFDRDNSLVYFQSWDDPNPKRSFSVYDSVSEHLLRGDFSDREVLRSIIGTIGSADQPLSPSAKGVRARNLYLLGISEEERATRREEVLSTSSRDFKKVGELLKNVSYKHRVLVSSRDLGNSLGFDEIE